MNKKIKDRFNELENDIIIIMNTEHDFQSISPLGKPCTFSDIDKNLFKEWYYKVRNLFILCSGKESLYSKDIIAHSQDIENGSSINIFNRLIPIFKAAKNDFEKGYLTSIRTLVTAEVFDSELEQAQELLDNKYHSAAAVIAGVVLETGLRELCDKYSIEHGKLDRMNAELKKANAYNQLQAKKIIALADIRNSAAHGKTEEFTHDDVQNMIRDIESFLTNNLN